MNGQNELFQKLKPHCVALAQSGTALKTNHGNQQDVIIRLESLKDTLLAVTLDSGCSLDAKLADYVFFPLAQLLKDSQRLSIRFFELCLQSIAILVEKGWKQKVPPQLATQMIILCTRLGERNPKGFSFSTTTDDLQAWSFWCQFHLFTEGGKNAETRELLTSESNFLHLAQTMTNLLDGVEKCVNDEPQLAGATALLSLVNHILDIECQASFLPGFVSKLTKILAPNTSKRRNARVLVLCLDVLTALLRNTMNDKLVKSPDDARAPEERQKMGITKKWQETAVSELKPAINKILRLKSHARYDVKDAVTSLCVMLLRGCRKTLANCAEIALEALVAVAANGDESQQLEKAQSLVLNDPSVAIMLQTMLYDWLRNIPTVMQSSDDDLKSIKMRRITTSYKLLLETEIDMTTISRAMATQLRDGAMISLGMTNREQQVSSTLSPLQSVNLNFLDHAQNRGISGSRLVKHSGQNRDLEKLGEVAKLIGISKISPEFTTELSRYLGQSTGQTQLASFWLLQTTVEATAKQENDLNDLLNLGPSQHDTNNTQIEQIYTFSLSTLTETSDEPQEPRLLALALRGLALRAQTAGADFKYELVDALYPVLHTLATPDDDLQNESIKTLNIFTSACGYGSTRDLIVDNVDYLTNAVALKLNAFDVSPQAPQVLLMMVRLAGPSLLPYLQDTIESIFAALEDYHGYPLLVELLFKVLGAMAEEGVKTPQLSITEGRSSIVQSHTLDSWKPTTIDGLAFLLEDQASQTKPKVTPRTDREPHPKRPWKEHEPTEESEDLEESQLINEPDPPPPAPKTYDLLFKITELTQHYLPSASPSLRTSLLSLIRTTVPAIARHENSFLPLINTLWPEIVSRLDDEEPYTVASAIEVIGILCEYAGDFMRSRITQVWSRVLDFQREPSPAGSTGTTRAYKKGLSRPAPNDLQDTLTVREKGSKDLSSPSAIFSTGYTSRLAWEALVPTMTRIVSFVQISPEMFDDALEVLRPVIQESDVQQALHESNADALWLAQVKMGSMAAPNMPSVPAEPSWRFAAVVN